MNTLGLRQNFPSQRCLYCLSIRSTYYTNKLPNYSTLVFWALCPLDMREVFLAGFPAHNVDQNLLPQVGPCRALTCCLQWFCKWRPIGILMFSPFGLGTSTKVLAFCCDSITITSNQLFLSSWCITSQWDCGLVINMNTTYFVLSSIWSPASIDGLSGVITSFVFWLLMKNLGSSSGVSGHPRLSNGLPIRISKNIPTPKTAY